MMELTDDQCRILVLNGQVTDLETEIERLTRQWDERRVAHGAESPHALREALYRASDAESHCKALAEDVSSLRREVERLRLAREGAEQAWARAEKENDELHAEVERLRALNDKWAQQAYADRTSLAAANALLQQLRGRCAEVVAILQDGLSSRNYRRFAVRCLDAFSVADLAGQPATAPAKPTIAELEALLQSTDGEVYVLPNGELRSTAQPATEEDHELPVPLPTPEQMANRPITYPQPATAPVPAGRTELTEHGWLAAPANYQPKDVDAYGRMMTFFSTCQSVEELEASMTLYLFDMSYPREDLLRAERETRRAKGWR